RTRAGHGVRCARRRGLRHRQGGALHEGDRLRPPAVARGRAAEELDGVLEAAPGGRRLNRVLLWVALGAVVLGAVLRLCAARGDLWLDEIWSLDLARAAPRALDVIWGLHFDNNDYLNTLWMRLWGDDGSALVQRALSVATGAGLVALGAAAPLE